jgi:hypothetical protein
MSRSIKKNKKKTIPRNGAALAAKMRSSGGPMKHKLTPKGGAKNEEKELLSEIESDINCSLCGRDMDEPKTYNILTVLCGDCDMLRSSLEDDDECDEF